MSGFNIFKEASQIDSSYNVVKVAGILNRMKNWFKQMSSRDYRAQVEQLKGDSIRVREILPQLSEHLIKLEDAIKDSDINDYLLELEEVKKLSNGLLGELGSLNDISSVLQEDNKESGISTDVKSENINVNPQPQSGEANENTVEVPTGSYNKRLEEVDFIDLSNVSLENFSQTLADELKDSDIELAEEDALKLLQLINGSLEDSVVTKVSNVASEPNNYWVDIKTPPISLPSMDKAVSLSIIFKLINGKNLSPRKINSIKSTEKLAKKNKGIEKVAMKYESVASVGSKNKGLKNKSPEFIRELIAVGNRLNIDPGFLAAVMFSESGFNHTAVNPKGGATGLIQFMPSTAKRLGISTEDLKSMTDVEQLAYVERFFKPWAGRIKTAGDLYMATFLPVFVGKPSDHIIGQLDNNDIIAGKLTFDKVYRYNKVFDTDKDGIIRVSDVTSRANRFYNNGISRGDLTPETVDQSNPVAKGVAPKTDELTPELDKEFANALISIFAKETLEDKVKNAIVNSVLPEKNYQISILANETNDKIFFANSFKESIDKNVVSNVEILKCNNNVKVKFRAIGSNNNVKDYTMAVCNVISSFMNRDGVITSVGFSDFSNSNYKKVEEAQLKKAKRIYNIKKI